MFSSDVATLHFIETVYNFEFWQLHASILSLELDKKKFRIKQIFPLNSF